MDQQSILSIVAIVLSVGGTALAVINHTRVKSMCCGKKIEVSLDVDRTQPSPVSGDQTVSRMPHDGGV
jgi:hypothetical protein